MAGATRVESIVYLTTGQGEIGSTNWHYSFIVGEAKVRLPVLCSSIDSASANGECRVPLNSNWSARYIWSPSLAARNETGDARESPPNKAMKSDVE